VILKSGIKTTRKRMVDFPKIIGKRLSIDETFLSNGETAILTNKQRKEQ
jgi:hypothetical protein